MQALPKLSMQGKEKLLPQLLSERWLAETPGRRGCYSIGVRFQSLQQANLGLPKQLLSPGFTGQ